ncbi:MAG: diguanylate cyclase [Hydrogenovibrio sp.]|nr:diguanylate cyclase [Hydrogenovibrio sp.]
MNRKLLLNSNNLLIISTFLLILMMVAILVFASQKLTTDTLNKASQVIDLQYQKLHNLLNLHISGQNRTVDLELLMLLDDAFDQDRALMSFYRNGHNYTLYRNQLAKLIGNDPSENRWLEQINAMARKTGPLQDKIATMAMDGKLEQSKHLLESQNIPQLNAFSQKVNDFSHYQEDETRRLIGESKMKIDHIMTQITALAIFLVLISMLFAIMIARKFKIINNELKQTNVLLEKKVQARTKELTQIQDDLLKKNRILEELSSTDPLTQLYNRLKIEQILEARHQAFQKGGDSFSLLLIDIDYFKKINDTLGHPVGDQALQNVSELLRQTFQQSGHIGRWGGEEFIVILENSSLEDAEVRAETIRTAIETHPFSDVGQMTVSIGVATLQSKESISELIHRTDMALYDSKHLGRNRVTVHPG